MKLNNELENLILTICPHEEANRQVKTRTSLIEAWAQSLGICDIKHKELTHGDYAFVGEFRDHPINLTLQYKGYGNLIVDDIKDIEDKLIRSFEEYTDVAFFVDGYGTYTFKPDADSHKCHLDYPEYMIAGFRKRGIDNPPATMTLAGMEGLFDTLAANGVHCRQLRSEAQFPYSIYNLLVYLTNPHSLKVKETSYEQAVINHYMTIPQVGYVRAKKLINQYPAPNWLNSASEESLIQVLGKTTGIVVYQFLHNHSLETEAWKTGFHKNGTPKEPAIKEQKTTGNILLSDTDKASIKELNKPQLEQQAEIHLCATCSNQGDKCNADSDSIIFSNIEHNKNMVIHCDLYQDPAPHLCKICTKKPKTCNTSADDKLDNGIDVTLCMGYVNKYPSKPLTPDAKKHQDFKRQKAGFKPCLTPNDFILQLLSKNPNGIMYSVLADSCNKEYPTIDIHDLIHDLMYEGLCYEIKLGLIVATNSSYPEGTILTESHPPPKQPSNNTSGKEITTKGNLPIPDVQFIKSETKTSQSQSTSISVAQPLTQGTRLGTLDKTSQSQDLTIQPVAGMTPNMPEPEGASIPPSTPSYKKTDKPHTDKCINDIQKYSLSDVRRLDDCILKYCIDSHTFNEIISRHKGWSRELVFNTICELTTNGKLTRYEEKNMENHKLELRWVQAGLVKADEELDVGV